MSVRRMGFPRWCAVSLAGASPLADGQRAGVVACRGLAGAGPKDRTALLPMSGARQAVVEPTGMSAGHQGAVASPSVPIVTAPVTLTLASGGQGRPVPVHSRRPGEYPGGVGHQDVESVSGTSTYVRGGRLTSLARRPGRAAGMCGNVVESACGGVGSAEGGGNGAAVRGPHCRVIPMGPRSLSVTHEFAISHVS